MNQQSDLINTFCKVINRNKSQQIQLAKDTFYRFIERNDDSEDDIDVTQEQMDALDEATDYDLMDSQENDLLNTNPQRTDFESEL